MEIEDKVRLTIGSYVLTILQLERQVEQLTKKVAEYEKALFPDKEAPPSKL